MTVTPDLDRLLRFVRLTLQFQKIERALRVVHGERAEHNAEHSFQLAMVVWCLIESDKLDLDLSRAVMLALVHDLPELHSGDTSAYASAADRAAHADRETAAIVRLRQEWPELTTLHELLVEYSAQRTPESRLVNALDKLLPILNNFEDGGRNWHEHGIDLNRLLEVKGNKMDRSSAVAAYYQAVVAVLRQHPELFAAPD